MSEAPKNENLDEAKRIMERLVKTPPTPHESKDKGKDSPSKKETE